MNNEDCPCALHECEKICSSESRCGDDLLNVTGLCRLAFALVVTIVCLAAGIRGIPAYIMALAAIAAAGYDLIVSGVQELIAKKRLNESVIITLCCIGCLAIGRCAEAAAVMLIFQAGSIVKHIIIYKSRETISSSLDLRPDVVTILNNGSITGAAASQAEPGTALIIKPGERAALDCVVTEGVSTIDSSDVSDIELPWTAGPGSEIPAGSLNRGTLIYVKTLRSFDDSEAARALAVTESADTSSSKLQRLLSRFSSLYSPALVAAAILLAFIPPIVSGAPLSEWVRRAIVFAAVASPCALIISIPLVYFAGIASAAQKGILFKDSADFDSLSRAEAIICGSDAPFSRTDLRVTEIHPVGISDMGLMALAAHALASSESPFAGGVIRAYKGDIHPEKVTEREEFPGEGVQVKAMGKCVRAGSADFIRAAGAEVPESDVNENALCVSLGSRFVGYILFKNAAQEEASQAIAEMKKLGVRRAVMADAVIAADTDEDAALDACEKESALLSDLVSGAHRHGKTVIYAGRNSQCLNDADIGIMPVGKLAETDTAACDAMLLRGCFRAVADLCASSRAANRILLENVILAALIKAAVLVLAIFGITAVWFAVIAELCAAVLTLLNSSRAFLQR
ncbi:MAG: hypothetical protein II784_05195 [Oscillospiraceae bacterium]|nr:hypothetical protein [Oscillospiraceae bacterium]